MSAEELPSSAEEVAAQRWTRSRVARALFADPGRGADLSPVSVRGLVAGPLLACLVGAVVVWESQIRTWLAALTG